MTHIRVNPESVRGYGRQAQGNQVQSVIAADVYRSPMGLSSAPDIRFDFYLSVALAPAVVVRGRAGSAPGRPSRVRPGEAAPRRPTLGGPT